MAKVQSSLPGDMKYPDMVFAANAALVKGNRAVIANFAVPARQGETIPYKSILENTNFIWLFRAPLYFRYILYF